MPFQSQCSSQCFLLPENLMLNSIQEHRKHKDVKKFGAEIPGWNGDVMPQEKLKLLFVPGFLLVSPPLLNPMFWVQRHPGASELRAAQDKDRDVLSVPWSIPNKKSSIRTGRLCWAAHGGNGALADVLEKPILAALKRLHEIIARCFNDIYYDSWAKVMFLWSNYSLPEKSAYWA